VLRLFRAKERPADDPLIVHVSTVDDVAPLAAELPPSAFALAARFWPGPLTIVVRRSRAVPDEVTAGLDTVAIRVPSHPVARALISAAGVPIAAPSANLFSRPSPTDAMHVIADLNDRIDMVVDGGPTEVGVESTVVDLSQGSPVILRPGAVGLDMLRSVLSNIELRNPTIEPSAAPRSPGLMSKHYAPRAPVTLYEGDVEAALSAMARDVRVLAGGGKSVAVLAYAEDIPRFADLPVRLVYLGSERQTADVAARLYAALRECDDLGADAILARTVATPHALSAAVRDRLRRAATRIVQSGADP
jgi:L-threonylcarbamoyladenylate synthase